MFASHQVSSPGPSTLVLGILGALAVVFALVRPSTALAGDGERSPTARQSEVRAIEGKDRFKMSLAGAGGSLLAAGAGLALTAGAIELTESTPLGLGLLGASAVGTAAAGSLSIHWAGQRLGYGGQRKSTVLRGTAFGLLGLGLGLGYGFLRAEMLFSGGEGGSASDALFFAVWPIFWGTTGYALGNTRGAIRGFARSMKAGDQAGRTIAFTPTILPVRGAGPVPALAVSGTF